MRKVQTSCLKNGPGRFGRRFALRQNSVAPRLLLAVLVWFAAGCHQAEPVDTKPLDRAGMSYEAIHQLQSQQISTPEVASVAAARQSGFSDADCIEVFQVLRGRNQPFDVGNTIAGLVRAGLGQDTVVDLAKLNQLGLGVGELQAIKLAGLSDEIILEVARHRSQGKPVLAGASLAALRNAGVRESTLLELTRRGVPDSQSANIVAVRRHGASDAEILGRFTGS
jgi:hypothetical protein